MTASLPLGADALAAPSTHVAEEHSGKGNAFLLLLLLLSLLLLLLLLLHLHVMQHAPLRRRTQRED